MKNINICLNNALLIIFSSTPIFLSILNFSTLSLDSDNSLSARIAAQEIKNKIPNTRMLIFSHNIDFVQKLVKDDDIQVYSFTPDELKEMM